MILLGAGGQAKELIDILFQINCNEEIVLFDDVTAEENWPSMFQNYKRISNIDELKVQFIINPEFIIGIGGMNAKHILWRKGIDAGGHPSSLIANSAAVSSQNIGVGSVIMQMAFISADVKIGKAVLINTRANIHHDVSIGDYSEIAPSAILLGKCQIGKNTFIGAGAIVLPGIIIGDNCTVGAGAVVTKNIPDNLMVKGNPAR